MYKERDSRKRHGYFRSPMMSIISSGFLAREDVGARRCVSRGLVRIICNAGISSCISTRESNQITWDGGSRARDLQLMASWVELRSGVGVSGVQCNDLVADEVVTGLEAGWDRVLISSVASCHQPRVTPDVARAVTAILGDLEPNSIIAWHVVGAASAGASSHVSDGGTDVRLGPQGPVKGHSGAGGGGRVQSRRRRTDNATISVTTTLEIVVRHVGDRTVALDGTRDSVGLLTTVSNHILPGDDGAGNLR